MTTSSTAQTRVTDSDTLPSRELGDRSQPHRGRIHRPPSRGRQLRGRFIEVAGTVTMAQDMGDYRVEVAIGMASVDTGHRGRDEHLR